jgi:hypothetical protein
MEQTSVRLLSSETGSQLIGVRELVLKQISWRSMYSNGILSLSSSLYIFRHRKTDRRECSIILMISENLLINALLRGSKLKIVR